MKDDTLCRAQYFFRCINLAAAFGGLSLNSGKTATSAGIHSSTVAAKGKESDKLWQITTSIPKLTQPGNLCNTILSIFSSDLSFNKNVWVENSPVWFSHLSFLSWEASKGSTPIWTNPNWATPNWTTPDWTYPNWTWTTLIWTASFG